MKPVIVVAFAIALASCQTTRIHSDCPSIVGYSRATMAQAAKELRALPQGSALERLVADYHRVRDACRLANH